jgi:hypothetical protein
MAQQQAILLLLLLHQLSASLRRCLGSWSSLALRLLILLVPDQPAASHAAVCGIRAVQVMQQQHLHRQRCLQRQQHQLHQQMLLLLLLVLAQQGLMV